MEIAILLAALLWLFKSIVEGKIVLVRTPLNIPIFLFIILVILQCSIGRMSSSRFGTIYPYATMVYFFEALTYILAFLVIVNNIQSRRKINRLLFTIISVGAVLSLYGIFQKLAQAPKIFWARPVHEVLLFYSSYINCNYFAGYINMVIFLSLGALLAYLGYLDKKRGYYKFDILEGWNGLFIFSIAVMVISLFHTFSQGGIVVFFMTLICSYLTFFKRMPNRRWISIIILTVAITSMLAMSIWMVEFKTSRYFDEMVRLFKEINRYGERIPVWTRTLNLVKASPIFGSGLATFQYIFPKYRPRLNIYMRHPHNDYLELLAETGVIGFLIFSLGMYIFFNRAIKLLNSRRDPYVRSIGYGSLLSLFSIFIYSFIDSNMHIGANALLFSFILAIFYVVAHNRVSPDGNESIIFKTVVLQINNRFKKVLFSILFFLVFLYLIVNVVSICVVDVYATIGKKEKDIEYVKRAISLERSSAEYHYLLADTLLESGFKEGRPDRKTINAIMDELKESIRLNPNVSRYHMRLGWMYSYIQDGDNAIKEFKRAQGLEPLNAFNYFILAVHYFNEATKTKGVNPYGSRTMEDGVLEYRKAISIDPTLTIESRKNLLKDYSRLREALMRYDL